MSTPKKPAKDLFRVLLDFFLKPPWKPSSTDIAISLARGQLARAFGDNFNRAQRKFESDSKRIDALFDELSTYTPSDTEYEAIMRELERLTANR